MRSIILAALMVLIAAPVGAEEVLYCTDTKANGFVWDEKEKSKPTTFRPQRFTMKVISTTTRVIKFQTKEKSYTYKCKKHDVFGSVHCVDELSNLLEPFIFGSKGYVRAFLNGKVLGGKFGDPNILVAYGTCAKF